MQTATRKLLYLQYRQSAYFSLLYVLIRSAYWKSLHELFLYLVFKVEMSFIEAKSPENAAKKVSEHPKVSVMVDTAIKTLAEPKGSSLYAIKKYIEGNYSVDIKRLSVFIRKYLKAAVERGDLLQPKGKGGSFKINKQKVEEKPKAPQVKAPKSLKMKTSTPKTTLKPKKAVAKSPSKSPVEKFKLVEVVPADATFSNPNAKKAKKPKYSLPTKPRKSVNSLPAKVKKPKKLMAKTVKGPKVSVSPGENSQTIIISPKSVKPKVKAKSTKAKKNPEAEKPALISKKVVAKKAPAKRGQK